MDSRSCEVDRLIERIEQINDYLVKETELESSELIASLKLKRDRLNTNKPVVKIVSPSPDLADSLKKKNLADSQLRSLYEFQAAAPISKIQQIIQHCDLICLIYYFKQTINKQQQKLIELAQQNNIDIILLVRQPGKDIQDASLSGWLEAQDCRLDQVQLPLDGFINLNQQSDIDVYQQLLWRSLELLKTKSIVRHQQELKTLIEAFFKPQISSVRQEIKSLNSALDRPIHYYRQQLGQISNRVRQEKQRSTTIIKQNINHLRSDLLNSFTTESLMFTVRQIIDLATIKVVREAEVTYLYLTSNNSVESRYIHDYVIELCQQKIDETITFQWSQIEHVYAEGGLNGLIDKMNVELQTITDLVDVENDLLVLTSQQPNLNFRDFIDLDCLRKNSRIVFDYHFTQSSWFRLLISVIIGFGIYFATLIFSGTGKYIGLVIVIFQIVNLITGQNPKKAKLKQHSKELKRLVDRQYQTLVRLVVDKLIHTLINALEYQTKLDHDQLEQAIANAKAKLERWSTDIEQNKERIDILQQQKAEILSWLD